MTRYHYRNGLWVSKGRPPWGYEEPDPDPDPVWPPVVGTYKPGPTTTGPRPESGTLEVYNGDFIINTANYELYGLDIRGRIILQSGGVFPHIHDCIVRGPGSSFVSSGSNFTAAIASTSSSMRGAMIEDVIISGHGYNTPWLDGIRGSDYTIRRSEITGTTDGLSLTAQAGNVTAEACWIHKGFYEEWIKNVTPNKPSQSDARTHNDAIQFHRGKNYVIRGNMIGGVRVPGPYHQSPYDTVDQAVVDAKNSGDDYENAGIILKQEVDEQLINKIENVMIELNWFAGGAASMNLVAGRNNLFESTTIRHNKFMRATWGGTYYYVIRSPGIANYDAATNVFEDTGLPVPVTKGSG